MIARLFVTALAVTAIQSGFAQKPYPLGSMVALPSSDPNIKAEACWKAANVRGVLLRVFWSHLQPTDGAYDWSYFTTGIQLATKYNKWVVISVDGSEAPKWLYTEGVPKWISVTGAKGPYPWNSTLQSKWSEVVTNLGSLYDGQPLVHAVTMWCGGTGIECFFAENQTDARHLDKIAGGGSGSGAVLWENAAKVLINDFFKAFPNTPVYLATGLCYPDSNATMTDLVNWYRNQSHYVNGIQSNALSATFPTGGIFSHTTLPSAILAPIMYQDLAPIISPRMQGATLGQVFRNGENENAQAIQVYPSDPTGKVLANFNAFVGAD
jgi:Beta-galactosidase